jgi:hypothetical protein
VGGLAILGVAGLYLAAAIWIVAKSPGWWRLVALLAVVLIPTADAMWGRYVTLPRLCNDGAADEYYIVKYGFPFVEGQDAAGTYYRFSRSDVNSKTDFERRVTPKARLIRRAVNEGLESNFPSSRMTIEEVGTGKVLAEVRAHTFLGGWTERLLARFTDAAVSGVKGCGWDEYRPERLLTATFDLGG